VPELHEQAGAQLVSLRLHQLVLHSAQAALRLQAQDGSFPAGHNGPRRQKETPLRNTGYWLITLLRAFQWTGESKFRKSATLAAGYLLSEVHRPGRATFLHRTSRAVDQCNGLIGQAWTLEALLAAAEQLESEEHFALAQHVFDLHPFDEEKGLWHSVEVDGEDQGICQTLNQQIWFAAMGSRLAQTSGGSGTAKVNRFQQRLAEHLGLDGTGLIIHRLSEDPGPRPAIRRLKRRLGDWLRRAEAGRLALGYHAFNLAGLCRFSPQRARTSLGKLPGVERALTSLEEPTIHARLYHNGFSYGYNPVGFEMALALETWPAESQMGPMAWVSEQLRLTFDWRTLMMTRGSTDAMTLAARIYEATLLPDYNLEPIEPGPLGRTPQFGNDP
jgi:hypothetical protein